MAIAKFERFLREFAAERWPEDSSLQLSNPYDLLVQVITSLDSHHQLPLWAAQEFRYGRAALIAAAVHEKQRDKIGEPYAQHPYRVFNNTKLALSKNGGTRSDRIAALPAAWLHDVVEDSEEFFYRKVDFSDLLNWGFTKSSVEIVQLLTRQGANQADYYSRIATHRLARLVKLADIADNTAPWRVAKLDAPSRARLKDKYAHALSELGATEIELDAYRAPYYVSIDYRLEIR